MKEKLEQLIKNLGMQLEDLKIDVEKNEYTFNEIFDLALNLKFPIRNLVVTLVNPNISYNLKSFEIAIKKAEIEKVKRNILSGYIINVEDKLYFYNRQYNITKKNRLSVETTNALFELLLKNDEWQIARMLSSKGLYYKFQDLNDSKLKYLLGDLEKDLLFPDYYTAKIYKELDDKSKEIVKNLLVKNYKRLVEIFENAKKDKLDITVEGDVFTTLKRLSEGKIDYNVYSIDDTYKVFEKEEQKIVKEIIKKIK